MNPSHYPQLITKRSSSFRGNEENESDSDNDSNSNEVRLNVNRPRSPNLLTPSAASTTRNSRYRRKSGRRSPNQFSEQNLDPGFVNSGSFRAAELDDMANIETVVVDHSINHISDDSHEVPDPDSKPSTARRPSSYYTPNMEDKFRRKLKFFFMDPCSKWKAKKRWPWKLCLQVLKIFLVTAQVVIFAGQRSGTVDYFERNRLALKHIFLEKWDATYETMPYPPAVGAYAVYSRGDLISHINNIMSQYYKMPSIAIGTFFWEKGSDNNTYTSPPPLQMCKKSYQQVEIFRNHSFIINPDVKTDCFPIMPVEYENGTVDFDIIKYLESQNISLLFSRLITIELNMAFRSYHLDLFTQHSPACFSTDVTVLFDNGQRNGQMLVDLTTMVTELECDGKILSEDAEAEERLLRARLTGYDSVVIVVVILSAFLCIRSMSRGQKLRKATVIFFNNRYGKQLPWSDQMEFVNFWYILIVLNDLLTLSGTCFKIMLENKKFSSLSENYDLCSILLGAGSLFAWCGVLRYLGFFDKYNILIITLKTAFPNVLRFMVCALILYLGFMFCGWVILGPYHIKFRHLSTSSECLFSLVNGDDMFVTFSATSTNNDLVWYFSRVYLYCFISLFIYIVLSLFIAVIMDTYETLKYYAENGFPKSDLFKFIEECNDLPSSGRFDDEKTGCRLFSCFPCCNSEESKFPSETTKLLNNST